MPAYLTDKANSNYDFGKDFNYAVWSEGTVVTLTNVPWNNDYRDVCQFPTTSGQTLDQYIDSNETTNDTITNISYIKFNVPVRINIPFNRAFKYNYLRVQNPLQPIPGTDILKSYYYFILDVKYLAPNATEVTIQLDVFQSFRNDFSFGNSYIERGHIGIANENAFNNYGRDYLTVPEGLDIGGEYTIIARKSDQIMDTATADILIISTVRLSDSPGTVSAPILHTAWGTSIQGLPSGCEAYIFNNVADFMAFFQSFGDKPWLTQGIISITMIPDITMRYGLVKGVDAFSSDTSLHPQDFGKYGAEIGGGKYTDMYSEWRNDPSLLESIPSEYKNLKKFLTYPYMVIEMTTWSATPIIIKPESWNHPSARIHEKAALVPPNQKIVIYPYGYNTNSYSTVDMVSLPSNAFGDPARTDYFDDGGDYLDMATQISNFPTLAIVNNMAIGYMAANAHGIAYQSTSADWTQQRALYANQVSYDQNAKGIQASKAINAVQNAGIAGQAANQNLLAWNNQSVNGIAGVIGAGTSALLGGVGSGITGRGNPLGGLAGIAGAINNEVVGSIVTGNNTDANTRSANITQGVSKAANTAQNNQTAYVNDTNKTLADWSAKGDYSNTIGAINAKVQDIKLTQPSISGQMGGEAFNLINGAMQVSLRWKLIDNAHIRTVGNYWLRYGYAVQQFADIPSSLMVMTKFTYWKLLETYIKSANMPEGFKQIIRGIFEKGVTVWGDPSYIGNISLSDNEPLGGITL